MHRKFSGFIHLFFVCAIFGAGCICHAVGPENTAKLSVKIAALADFPPQYSLDSRDKPTGFAVDVMQQVAELADLAPEYIVFKNWDEAQQALRSGAVDIIPSMGVTAARREFADFTAPVETFSVSIFVRKAESRIQSIEDLSGHKVAVVRVNAGYDALLKERGDIEPVITRTPSEAMMFLLSGQADALVYPRPVINRLARRSGIDDRLKAVGRPLKEIVSGIAVGKGRRDLYTRLDTAVRRFTATKAYERIYVRWYGGPESYWIQKRVFTAAGLILMAFAAGMFVMRYFTLARFSKTLEQRVQERTAALADSEENFRRLFESAFFGIATHEVVFDDEQRPVNYVFTNANPAFYSIFGFEPGSVPGRLATELFGQSEAPLLEEFLAVALEGQSLEKEIDIAAMGKKVKIAAYSHRHSSFVTMLEDITLRKEYELQLMKNQRRVQAILDAAPIPLALIDENENIFYINKAFSDNLGYKLEDMLTLEKWWPQAYPDAAYREEVIREWRRRVAESEKDQAPFIPMEVNIQCKDGSNRVILATSTLLKGFAETTRFVTLYDITRNKIISQRLKTLLATASDGIHVLDEEGNVVEFSDSFARMLGYSVEEAARLNVADWEARIARNDLKRLIKQRIESSVTFETRHRRKDGSVFDVEINAKGIVLDGRRLLYASSRDITERRKMEKAHRQSEARFRRLFEVTAVPLCHVRRNGEVLAVNSKFVETFGYVKEDIQTIDKWWTLAYPDPQYRRRVMDIWNAAVQEAINDRESIRTQEYQVTCKNGDVRSVLIGGSIYEKYFLANFFDITELRKAERSLRYYEKIASSVDTLLSLVDRSMVYLQVNDALAEIFGRQREEIIGKSMQEILNAEAYQRMKPQIKRSLAGETVSEEMWLRLPGERRRLYNITLYPMFDEDAMVYAVAGVGYDMTEIHQASESLQTAKKAAESANRAKSFFLSNMTHELRTPLNAILGYTQILTADKTLGAKQQSGVRTIHQAGEHLLMIINDVLDMSKIEAGKLQLVPSEIQLLPFFQNIMDFFKHRTQEKGIDVTFETGRSLPAAIIADELRLRQVIFNLLSNAIKFTAKGYCRLQVEAEDIGENRCRLKIGVEDSGVGIPQDQHNEIFEPFKQVGERLQYKEGSGLGLAISRQLVHLMDGRIVLKSPVNTSPVDGVGVGSRFSFTIEAQVVEAGRPAALQNSKKITGYKQTGEPKEPVRILVVDDKITNRAVLRDALEPLGFVVEDAADGIAVPEICLRNKPDLILMDLRMPNVDGFSAMSTLKRHKELQDIPVMALTASMVDSTILEKRCIEHGFKSLVLKPFVISTLLEEIAQLLPITLVYQQDGETKPDDLSQMRIPPSEEIAKLSKSLSKGDIEEILEHVETIGRLENGKYQAYSNSVRKLAEDFKFSELENFILSKGGGNDE